jgi:carbamoyl-phosphate synthase small subunit
MNKKKMKLILENGREFQGYSFGAERPVSGEVVFNTAMAGYPESITDPSYEGQILVLTYPLIGNYGVPESLREDDLLKHFESEHIHIKGLIISDYSFRYSHWSAKISLSQWLKANDVPGIYGVDTRALTKILREKGSMLGKMAGENLKDIDYYDPNQENLVAKVSTKSKMVYGKGKYKILLIDCGVKYNIIRCLLKRNTTILRVPWNHNILIEDYDGLFISNGPGDPKQCQLVIQNIAKCFENSKPIFGICLGNQLMGLASGANTYKLKYGHRSHNQPVLQRGTNRAFITSQNHGYAIDNDSLQSNWEPLFYNLNDGTNEGLKHKTKPFFSSQFHPEASSGPTDTEFLFDDFLEMIKKFSNK